MEDNYGTSYYYRGAVEDNYVKFAGFYWRIIRINGDGSLRIIYDGTQTHANGANSTDRLSGTIADWNTTNYNDNKYVGYMYGGANGTGSTSKSGAQTNQTNTSMKNRLERWYKSNIVDKGYDEDVSDNIFCNDRTTPGKSETGWQDDTGLGYGTRITVYGAVSRLYHYGANGYESIPNFTCENNNDAFTKEDTEKGNGKLGEKVGLITADEIVVAGSGFENKKNSNYYLYKGSRYWSFSPYYYSAFACMYVVNDNGDLSRLPVHNNIGFAPVINLSAEYVSTMSGNGTMESPFEA